EREISSCRVESNSSGPLVTGQTRISSSFGSTVPSRRSDEALIYCLRIGVVLNLTGSRGVMTLTSAPVRRPRPVVALSATVDPIAQSRDTPNRKFVRDHEPVPLTIPTAPASPPHSSAAADRSPARRRGQRERHL